MTILISLVIDNIASFKGLVGSRGRRHVCHVWPFLSRFGATFLRPGRRSLRHSRRPALHLMESIILAHHRATLGGRDPLKYRVNNPTLVQLHVAWAARQTRTRPW